MYIIYSIVRINSILKNNKLIQLNELKYINDIENKIIKKLYLFPEIIDDLLKSNEPSHLTKYLFYLTQDFSKFYENISIKNEKEEVLKNSRIRLIKCIKTVLENGLSILGINTVDDI